MELIIYYILLAATILILFSCKTGSKRNKANKRLEDKMNNLE